LTEKGLCVIVLTDYIFILFRNKKDMEEKKVQSFKRMFAYVWPQWPRIVVVVFMALLIGILFSLSFATVIPLLKVMMGEEGLHGWVDRKTCNWRYGMDFYVPDIADFADADNSSIAYSLLVTSIKDDGFAEDAGLREQDRIVGVGAADTDTEKMLSSVMLERLASSDGDSIDIRVRRLVTSGISEEEKHVELITSQRPFYIDHVQWVISFLPRGNNKESKKQAIIFIILMMAVVTLVRCFARFWQQYMATKIVQVAIANLREDVFAHVMEMPIGFFSSQGTSDTVSRIIGDTAGAGNGVKVLLGKTLREPLKAIGTLTCAMIISYKLTLIFICCAPATVGLGYVLGSRMKKFTKRSLKSSAMILGRIQDAVGALGVVKVYNRQEHESDSYSQINRKLLRQMLRITKINAMTGPIMEVLGMIAGSLALLVGVHWVTNANMQPSSFFGLLVLLGTTAESIRKVSDVWNKIQSANAASERVFEVMDQPAEIEKPDAIKLLPLKGRIEFRDIVFTYPGSDNPVLKRVNLTVEAGQTVAVVGPNGSGKTTLVNLIPRFYDVDSGAIIIDGHDIKDGTLKSLRDQIGLVTQNVVTFNDTVAANIGYGKKDATLAQIKEAAKRSFAHEFIEPLPEGYGSMIGEHGSGFSGGQLQRMVIARAILKNPPILIFDEATSQVDADSEAKIHSAVSEMIHDRTCFIIAHRFSTVISADMIVVMDDGQIVAKGKHSELIESCHLYQSLYETQLIGDETK
jgi:ATP-binding cassette, subfamily B, bacterial MsbA